MTVIGPLLVGAALLACAAFFVIFLGAMAGAAFDARRSPTPRLDAVGAALVGSTRQAFLLGLSVLAVASIVDAAL